MTRLGLALSSLLGAAALLAAPGASASTEFGSNCEATQLAPGYILVSLDHGAGSPLPVAAPVGGVITRWQSTVSLPVPPEASSVYAQRLQVLRPTDMPNQFTKVAESVPAAIATGPNSFATRIPVQAGDRLGISGVLGALYCETKAPADVIGTEEVEGETVPVGSAVTFSPLSGYQVPASAVIEPDADGDGYGDETQDGCPQSAAYHSPCPVVALDASSLAGRGSVVVYVTTDLEAAVTVNGTVQLGKGQKARLKAGPKTAAAGKITRFTLKFSKNLKQRLGELEPSQKLTLKISASATNVAGVVSTAKSNAKLKGQG